MGIYAELDIVISEYVGYKEDTDDRLDESADPVLYDNITSELTRYIREEIRWDKLSKDAQYCFQEWESIMQNMPKGGLIE